jgi:hypothetical protein
VTVIVRTADQGALLLAPESSVGWGWQPAPPLALKDQEPVSVFVRPSSFSAAGGGPASDTLARELFWALEGGPLPGGLPRLAFSAGTSVHTSTEFDRSVEPAGDRVAVHLEVRDEEVLYERVGQFWKAERSLVNLAEPGGDRGQAASDPNGRGAEPRARAAARDVLLSPDGDGRAAARALSNEDGSSPFVAFPEEANGKTEVFAEEEVRGSVLFAAFDLNLPDPTTDLVPLANAHLAEVATLLVGDEAPAAPTDVPRGEGLVSTYFVIGLDNMPLGSRVAAVHAEPARPGEPRLVDVERRPADHVFTAWPLPAERQLPEEPALLAKTKEVPPPDAGWAVNDLRTPPADRTADPALPRRALPGSVVPGSTPARGPERPDNSGPPAEPADADHAPSEQTDASAPEADAGDS